MKQLWNRLILLLYCSGAVLFLDINTAFLVALLVTVLLLSLDYSINSLSCRYACFFLYLGVTLFIPECILFFPVILYGIWKEYHSVFLILMLMISLWHLQSVSVDSRTVGFTAILFFLIVGCAFAILLKTEANAYELLYRTFKQTRDDSEEHQLLMKAKHKSLLDKQDSEIYTATLRERNRIAREIHDNVGHMLSRAILMTGALKAINKDPQLSSALEHLEETLHTAMTNVRESVHDLHDDSINLKEVLTGLATEFTFCPVIFSYDMGYEIPRAIKYSFITIVKEALHNTMKHSNATEVTIAAREHPGLYQLIIEDNGTTFDETKGTGLGLINMKERVDNLEGTLQIQSENGFRIFITIPKKGASQP